MYRFKRALSLSLILLIILTFAASSAAAAAKTVTREEFFSALYDARGIELTKETKKGGKIVNEKLTSASDKAAACFKLGYAGMPNTGIAKASAPAAEKLNAPITRLEAIRYIIQSLGLSFEAHVLSRLPSSYSDLAQSSAYERGCVAVAEMMFPPFLDKNDKTPKNFNPKSQLTKEELNKLMANVRNAVGNLLLDLDVSPAKGVMIRIHREGAFTGAPKWRLNLHGFESEEEANIIAEQIQDVKMTPNFTNYEWSLRGELLDDWREVEKLFRMLQGLNKQIAIVPSVVNAEGENQPRYWTIATIPPDGFSFRILTPPAGITSLSVMSQMNRGNDVPILAVNAGYFTWTGKLQGNPIGTLVVDGELASAPYLRRTTIGWGGDKSPIFGFPKWSQEINIPYSPRETLDKINFYSKNTLLTAYTSIYGIPTPVPEVATTEIFIKDGRCVGKAYGGTLVNKGDVIVAAYGPKALLLDNINPGEPMSISLKLTQSDGDFSDWESVTDAIQAGPMLLVGGNIYIDPEGFENSFINNRHPRTAVGIDGSGNWMFFIGDGRNGMHSIGYTLEETALIMQQFGAEYALNFDGGGSTEILVKGQLFNWPSESRERAINNAIGVYNE
ncbi:MAG: phosphodiester glycosidase family protein [Synergistaceae bacterium]|nr:phosphodiester glycosidase family protein [Synergistaceae bacterium]